MVEERRARGLSGWIVLPVWLALAAWAAWGVLGRPIVYGGEPSIAAIVTAPLLAFLLKGFLILEPNQAAVMVFFGKYAGSLGRAGFHWVNPFYAKHKLSQRANNLNTPTLKVNDRAGNPIEVAAVIVWRVYDTARATFDVENYYDYVTMQSESAVRQVVSERWYDGDEGGNNSLRSDLDAVARLLERRVDDARAGGLEPGRGFVHRIR